MRKKTPEILAYRGNAVERMEESASGMPEEDHHWTGDICELGIALVREKQEV